MAEKFLTILKSYSFKGEQQIYRVEGRNGLNLVEHVVIQIIIF